MINDPNKYGTWQERVLAEKPRQTNADRIRSMTDEELAEFLCHVSFVSDSCYGCVASEECAHGKGFITWLGKESE